MVFQSHQNRIDNRVFFRPARVDVAVGADILVEEEIQQPVGLLELLLQHGHLVLRHHAYIGGVLLPSHHCFVIEEHAAPVIFTEFRNHLRLMKAGYDVRHGIIDSTQHNPAFHQRVKAV